VRLRTSDSAYMHTTPARAKPAPGVRYSPCHIHDSVLSSHCCAAQRIRKRKQVVSTIRIHRTLAVSFLGITLIVYSLGMDRLILFVISFDGDKALDSTSAFTKLETPDQWFPAFNSLCRFRQPPTRDKAQPKMVSTAGLEYSA